MDTITLAENRIDDGRKLIERLALNGIDVAAAAWVMTGELSVWYLYIVTDAIDKKGPTAAYRDVYDVHRSMLGVSISASEIKLIGRSNPIARDILTLRGGSTGAMPVHVKGSLLGGMVAEEAYIYAPYAPLRLSFRMTYTRLGETNQWQAQAERGSLFRGTEASGAVSYTTARWGGEEAGTERFATVAVLLDVGPQFDDRRSLEDPNVGRVMSQQAAAVADEMFKSYHPDAVIEHVDDEDR